MQTVPTRTATSITSWNPPTWADQVTDEGDLIEAFNVLGSVPGAPRKGLDIVTVIIVQRDEITSTPDNIAVQRHPAEVLVGGVSLTVAQAGELADLINSAVTLLGGTPK